jgi:hypothetical protein
VVRINTSITPRATALPLAYVLIVLSGTRWRHHVLSADHVRQRRHSACRMTELRLLSNGCHMPLGFTLHAAHCAQIMTVSATN